MSMLHYLYAIHFETSFVMIIITFSEFAPVEFHVKHFVLVLPPDTQDKVK